MPRRAGHDEQEPAGQGTHPDGLRGDGITDEIQAIALRPFLGSP